MLCILFCILFFMTQKTNASIPGLSGHYSKSIVSSQMDAAAKFPLPNKEATCQSQILNITQDNELTIFVALGYIDFSAGQDFDSSTSLYQFGDVLDLDAYDAFVKALTRQCSSASIGQKSKIFACGFSRSNGGFSKTIRNRFTGKNMRVYIKLASSAYTSNDNQNKTTYAAQQTAKSKNTQAQFLSALKSYDAVIYLGHARSGGGPDFFPPKLLANQNVDYGYYKKNQPGIKAMLGALQGSSDSDVIGVLACKSTNLFASSIRKYAPNSGLITADKLFAFDDLIPTGFTLVEALVGQRCNENFSNVVQNHLPGDLLSMYF